MITNLIFLAISIGSLLKLPTGASLWLDFGLYSSLLWYQHCFARPQLANVVLWMAYGTLAFLFLALGCTEVLPLTGVVVYFCFACTYGFQAVRGAPPHSVCVIYALLSLACLGLSFALRPDPSYIYAPLALFGIGAALRSRLTSRLAFKYRYQGYTIRQAVSPADLERYNQVLGAVYGEILLQIRSRGAPAKARLGMNEFLGLIHERTIPGHGTALFVIETSQGKTIGCFKMCFEKPLPFETELGIDLSAERRRSGSIAEIGRLAIIEQYRLDGVLMECVFRAAGRLCMRRQVRQLFCQALEGASAIYRKIGFQSYPWQAETIIDEEFGLPCRPYQLNIAAKIEASLIARARSGASWKGLGTYRKYLSKGANA